MLVSVSPTLVMRFGLHVRMPGAQLASFGSPALLIARLVSSASLPLPSCGWM